MKKALALILAAIMVLGIGSVAFGAASYIPRGAGSSTATNKGTATMNAAAVSSSAAAAAATGTWTAKASDDWSFENYKSRWGLIENPYAAGGTKPQWFFFDSTGKMLTGWVWIKGADGVTRCYYLNPNHDGSYGACFLNGTTPDGWSVDASGAWTVNGVVQTK